MLSMKKKLDELSENGRDIKIGIVGIGKMGRGLVNQLSYIKGIKPSLLINRTPQKAGYTAMGMKWSLKTQWSCLRSVPGPNPRDKNDPAK